MFTVIQQLNPYPTHTSFKVQPFLFSPHYIWYMMSVSCKATIEWSPVWVTVLTLEFFLRVAMFPTANCLLQWRWDPDLHRHHVFDRWHQTSSPHFMSACQKYAHVHLHARYLHVLSWFWTQVPSCPYSLRLWLCAVGLFTPAVHLVLGGAWSPSVILRRQVEGGLSPILPVGPGVWDDCSLTQDSIW